MIAKSDLQAVLDEMQAESRHGRVEPPTVEEMLAYRRGELSDQDEARVRELLICYPELLRALMTPLPDDGGDLPDEKLEAQWTAMRAHMRGEGAGRVVHLWQAVSAIAASLAIVLGALYWQERLGHRQPQVLAIGSEVLTPGGSRGPGERTRIITPQGDWYVLQLVSTDPRPFDQYRIEIRDVAGSRSVWKEGGLRQRGEETIVIVPLDVLQPGRRYTLDIYGAAGGREELSDAYEFSVAAPRAGR